MPVALGVPGRSDSRNAPGLNMSRCSGAPNGQGMPGLPESSLASDAPVDLNATGASDVPSASDAEVTSDAPAASFP